MKIQTHILLIAFCSMATFAKPDMQKDTTSTNQAVGGMINPLQPGDSTSPGGLNASAYPKHSKLYLNNIYIGVGEANVSGLEPGEYILTAKTDAKSKTVDITIEAGHIIHKEVLLSRKTKVFISSAYGMTLFKNKTSKDVQYAWGPMFEFGVSVQERLYLGFDFHWGFWSEADDSVGGVSSYGKTDAFGGKMKMCWQKMFLNDHIGLLLGGGIGFYSTGTYDVTIDPDWDYTERTTTYNGGYFGGPTVTAMFGGPIAYGTIGYDMYWGTGVAHQFKMGIAAYF